MHHRWTDKGRLIEHAPAELLVGGEIGSGNSGKGNAAVYYDEIDVTQAAAAFVQSGDNAYGGILRLP